MGRSVASPLRAVMQAFDVSGTEARLLLRLYEAGGRLVRGLDLMETMSTQNYDSMRSTLWRLRKRLEAGTIESERGGARGGRACGYRLSARGISRMMAVLYPVELQPVRGSAP